MFKKTGAGKFSEVSDAMGVENYCPWGPSVGDLNADGFDDIFIASGMNYPYRYEINSVKLNNRDAGSSMRSSRSESSHAPAGSPRRGSPGRVRKGRDHKDAVGLSGEVEIWGARASRGAAMFDVDGDGDLDIVTNEFNTAPMILISNLAERTRVHYLEVKLVGTTSNRDGLGAVVRVERRRANLLESDGRQFRLFIAQRVPAVLRPWIRGQGRSRRGDMAVGEHAGGQRSSLDQHYVGSARRRWTALGQNCATSYDPTEITQCQSRREPPRIPGLAFSASRTELTREASP